ADEQSQQFKFDVAPGHRYYVKPRTADMYFDVSDNSTADGAAICLWTWNNGTPNQQFQFISAGGGYKERVIQLEQKLDGIRKTIILYQETSIGSPQKGQYFTNVLSALAQAEPNFFDPRDPQKVLTYFVALGTVKLTMMREQALFYKEIYGTADLDKDKHLENLKKTIKDYKAAGDKSRAKALEWRLGLIRLEHRQEHPIGVLGPTTTDIWSVVDSFDGGGGSWQRNSLTGGDPDPEGNARRELERRTSLVRDQYSAELDSFLAPAYLWPYLDPTNPDKPKRKAVVTADGFYGGTKESAFDDNPGGQPITRIVVHAGSRVDGVEVFYGGKSGGLHGKRGGNTFALDLQPGESVVGVYGRSGAVLDSLYFETDRGHILGGGGRGGGGEWRADPPEGTDATLMKISGFQGSGHLEGIKLHWQYWRDE
ncbi:MAG: jacalin-like lectin, partial [Pyrinomonadaceae bacterium]